MMRIFLAVWLGLVIAVSITPLSFKLKLHTIGAYHDFGHYVVYAVTGIMLWLIAEQWFGKVAAFLFGFAVAFGQEWAENRLYHAGFEWRDVGMDLAGLVTGYALMLLITALLEDPRRDRPVKS
jgi:hypothetical protein